MKISLNSKWNRVMDCSVIESRGLIVSACDDHTLKVWNTTENFREVTTLIGHMAPVRSCSTSADGMILVSASSDRSIIVWDLQTYRKTHHVTDAHTTRIFTCSITADGKMVATASEEGTIKIWALENGKLSKIRDLPNKHLGRISDSSISADGKFLITGGEDGLLNVWDLRTFSRLQSIQSHSGRVIGCSIADDSRFIASSSSDSKIYLHRYDESTGFFKPFGNDRIDKHEVRCCSINHAGTRLLVGFEKGLFHLYEITADKLRLLYTLTGHLDTIRWCYYSDSLGQMFTAGEDSLVKIWRSDDYSPVKTLYGHAGPIQTQAYHKDRETLFYTLGNSFVNSFYLYSQKEGKESRPFKGRVTALTLVDDDVVIGTEAGVVYFSDIALKDRRASITVSTSSIRGLARVTDEQVLAGATDGRICLLSAAAGVIREICPLGGRGVTSLAYFQHPKLGGMACAGTYDGQALFFNVKTGEQIREIKIGEYPIWNVAVSGDGNRLGFLSHEPGLTVVNCENFRQKAYSFGNRATLTAGAFDQTGKLILTTSFDNLIRLISLDTGLLVAEFRTEGALHSGIWLDDYRVPVMSCLGNYGRYLLTYIP